MSNLKKLFISVAALTLVGAACGSDEDSGPGEVPVDNDELGTESNESLPAASDEAADDGVSGALVQGLQVTSVDFTTGVATITNLGDRDIDLTGHWICNRPNYAELPATILVPGDSVEASLGGFPTDGGEVAVYDSDAFGDPASIQAYVSWGSGGGRQPVAEDAGIWSGSPVQPAGETIELTGAAGSAAGWT